MKLTPKSAAVFEYVKENGKVSATEIAEALGVAPRSANANITDLSKKGLVVRSKEMKDEKEVTYVTLTDEGKTFVPSDDEE